MLCRQNIQQLFAESTEKQRRKKKKKKKKKGLSDN
jgi:hypothetical protein